MQMYSLCIPMSTARVLILWVTLSPHKDFDAPEKYFGLIRAVIHLSRGLYYPVLPHKTSKGKLVFTLTHMLRITTSRGLVNLAKRPEHSQKSG